MRLIVLLSKLKVLHFFVFLSGGSFPSQQTDNQPSFLNVDPICRLIAAFHPSYPSYTATHKPPPLPPTHTHSMASDEQLQQPQAQHRQLRRRSLSQSSLDDPNHATEPFPVKRSVSYLSSIDAYAADFRIRISYQDEALRLRAQANSKRLLQSALDESDASQLSNSARIAKKALKYRKVLDRVASIDVNDPHFDASKFLGVHWCKTIILADTAAAQS